MSSLDDFFAKKDRKKSATKTNLLAADELYRTLEETVKAPKEVDSKDKLQFEVINSTKAALAFGIRFSDEAVDEEDEWCDFTEDHDQPFPKLKRNSRLALSPTAAVANEDVPLSVDHCHIEDTGGDGLDVGQCTDELYKSACPWLMLQPIQAVDLQSVKKHEVYVPPALRQSQGDFSVRRGKQLSAVPEKPAKGQAPDLNNVEFFPSLCRSRTAKRAK
ncbi:protein CDV3 homolog [Drosophila grimshawi]|uniref:GH10398 n=1 Tax=Drosophila grimshawi TaxID=7222 RepID=B4JEB9_DROGR|nr:protein CDV3 homolog [Drosophila grimshawi]EDW03639.1 GH10398 [Drosophila grimshawi]